MPVNTTQTLSKKDDAIFKTVMKYHESKQTKKALKACQTVLANNPEHGESLAMKGLIMSAPPHNKKEEAYDLVKLGLSKNFKSLICWHVYGLLHRSDKNYNEAIKCYKQALRIDEKNLSILRDLSMLQIQMRDLASLADTRQKLLELKPHSKPNWLLFAFSHHMQGNYDCALVILDAYESCMGLPDTKYDISELLLYRICIKFESGDYAETLKMFEQYKDKLVDHEYVLVTTAECHEKLGSMEKAAECYEKLIEINPENRQFIGEYVRTKANGNEEAIEKIYEELREKYPTSQTAQKMEADATTGETFRKHVTAFIRRYILRGIPSLGSALKSFYNTESKVKIIGEILAQMETDVREHQSIDGKTEGVNRITIFWVMIARANHHMRLKEYDTALEFIAKCEAHTPTVEMLYALKATINKKAGRFQEAADAIDQARRMDLADRYYNTQTCKALLRVNKWEEAEAIMNLFTYRNKGETWSNVLEMQVMWYELGVADCLYRLGDVESALRRYLLIDKHFADIIEDQFDFHHYVTRKMNMRAYIDLLRFSDTARNHKFYCNAAKMVIQCYLDIFESGKDEIKGRIIEKLKIAEAEREKTLSKDQKDRDKEFETIVDYEKPLAAAAPFLEELLKYRGTDLDAQLLAIKFYLAEKSPLKVLRAIKQALTIPTAAASAELKTLATSFFASQPADLNPVVKDLISSEQKEVLAKFN